MLLADLGVDSRLHRLRLAAGGADQAGRGAFFIVEQRLQQVLGGDPLGKLADGDGLGGLQKALGAFGEFLDIHSGACPFKLGGSKGRKVFCFGKKKQKTFWELALSAKGGFGAPG